MSPSKRKAVVRLQTAIDRVSALKQLSPNSSEFHNWERDVRVTILNTFGENSTHINEFLSIHYRPRSTFAGNPQRNDILHNYYVTKLDEASGILESMLNEVEDYWKPDDQSHSASDTGTSKQSNTSNTNEVFLVHGRDESAKQTVARFLEKLGLSPTILHEQPNLGRTLIEKFEQHSQAAFAVILLTPDDVGAMVGEEEMLEPRARQNVILELGYFLGLLGRDRVCPLIVEGVEIPSDYDGVAYVRLDESEGWRLKLVGELKAAGIDVDANLAL